MWRWRRTRRTPDRALPCPRSASLPTRPAVCRPRTGQADKRRVGPRATAAERGGAASLGLFDERLDRCRYRLRITDQGGPHQVKPVLQQKISRLRAQQEDKEPLRARWVGSIA